MPAVCHSLIVCVFWTSPPRLVVAVMDDDDKNVAAPPPHPWITRRYYLGVLNLSGRSAVALSHTAGLVLPLERSACLG